MQAFSLLKLYDADMTDSTSNLRRLREAAGLSQRELARIIGQDQSNVSFWERTGKKPKSEILIPMAAALGVTVEELLGEKKPRKARPAGRALTSFEKLSDLPRSQQKKILDVVDALVAQQVS
jgi:transcriptional regulator with XRE-family HTH domain